MKLEETQSRGAGPGLCSSRRHAQPAPLESVTSGFVNTIASVPGPCAEEGQSLPVESRLTFVPLALS